MFFKKIASNFIFILFLLCVSCEGNHSNKTELNSNVPKNDINSDHYKPYLGEVMLIKPDMISLKLSFQDIQRIKHEQYFFQENDKIYIDENSQKWIIRNGKNIGALVGQKQTLLKKFDVVYNTDVAQSQLDNPDIYILSSEDTNPKIFHPASVFRKTKPIDLIRSSSDYIGVIEHIIYLKLPFVLESGKTYTLEAKNLFSQIKFTFDPQNMFNEAIHVSQIGFRPDDPWKTAFISLWMGNGEEFNLSDGAEFYLKSKVNNKIVYRGKIVLSKSASQKDEDYFKKNYSGVDVYLADFSNFNENGEYRVCLLDMGCSYPFTISNDVWQDAFYISIRGLYHQRSGVAIGPPFTSFIRPRCFHPDEGTRVFASTVTLMETSNGINPNNDTFKALQKGKTNTIINGAWGGYFDAGDWDRRIQHLVAARNIFDLMLLFPDYFSELNLFLPESNDNLPDMVNEALWGIDFYMRLQEPDGGIRGGIESVNHPNYGEGCWLAEQDLYGYASDPWSSYLFAATAARASFYFYKQNNSHYKTYLDSALKAMFWAEKKIGAMGSSLPREIRDARNLAAIELYRLTKDKKWHAIFLSATKLKTPGSPIFKGDSHDQIEAAWVYINGDFPEKDNDIMNNCIRGFISEADKRIENQINNGFKWSKNYYKYGGIGSFTVPDVIFQIRAHILTGNEKYLKSIIAATQSGLGANPLNISYTTGVGYNYPQNVMHSDSLASNQSPPHGLTVFGPLDPQFYGSNVDPIRKYSVRYLFPKENKWPILESFWDVYWYPLMCEFTIETIAQNFYVWGYLSARK